MLLLASVLGLAACGGGDSDDGGSAYVERVNKAQQEFAARVDKLSEGITATSSAARDRETLRSFQEAVDEVGGDLRAIKPPGRVRGLHERLIAAVDSYGTDVEKATAALRSRSPQKLRAAQRELASATTDFGSALNRTIDEINREFDS